MKKIILLSLFGFIFSYDQYLYLGLGTSENSTTDENYSATSWSLGWMVYSQIMDSYVGFDLGGEGTMSSSTYGIDTIEQSLSYNVTLLKPFNVSKIKNGIGIILGMRQIEEYCSSGESYLGYACYADEDPSYNYEVNLGGVLSASFQKITFAFRFTGVSRQATIGYNLNF